MKCNYNNRISPNRVHDNAFDHHNDYNQPKYNQQNMHHYNQQIEYNHPKEYENKFKD